MQIKDRSRIKRIGVDIVGFGLILAAGLTGWLPGPGGIPLLILGLSVLATNHEWAERLLTSIKSKGFKFSEKIFSESPKIRVIVDVCSIACIATGVLVLHSVTHSVLRSVSISLFLMATVLLLGNRNRAKKLRKIFKKD